MSIFRFESAKEISIINTEVILYLCNFYAIRRQNYGRMEDMPMARKGENIYKRKDGRWEGQGHILLLNVYLPR